MILFGKTADLLLTKVVELEKQRNYLQDQINILEAALHEHKFPNGEILERLDCRALMYRYEIKIAAYRRIDHIEFYASDRPIEFKSVTNKKGTYIKDVNSDLCLFIQSCGKEVIRIPSSGEVANVWKNQKSDSCGC